MLSHFQPACCQGLSTPAWNGRRLALRTLASALLGVGFLYLSQAALPAQTSTNGSDAIPDPSLLEIPGASARSLAPHQLPAEAPPPGSAPLVQPAAPVATAAPAASASLPSAETHPASVESGAMPLTLAGLMTLTALGGFLLYQCGMTRAKNCAHTAVLLLLGVSFALIAFWMGGFAVQTGGIDDAHTMAGSATAGTERDALDHELGLMTGEHHWGLMGNAGFFLVTDDANRDSIAELFLAQAVLLVLAVAAALGAGLERARLLSLAVIAFLAGAVIFPLPANWVWGGGWLAELGHEFGLGHGVVDLAGAGAVHEAAGTLALVLAIVLGPRQGRFKRNKMTGIPGHNVPFTLLGTLLLLVALMASNVHGPRSGVAAVNVLLGAVAALMVSVFLSAWLRHKVTPARLTRGLLVGAVSICGGSGLFEPWAAFIVGACAGLLVELVIGALEAWGVDDPVNATAIHGAGGAWGLLATGIFADGSQGSGLNGVAGPVRGLFYGGAWHQLGAQAIGCAATFLCVFLLSYLAVLGVKKILGLRAKMTDELQGLDWPQVGALGYQPDVESGDEPQWFKLE